MKVFRSIIFLVAVLLLAIACNSEQKQQESKNVTIGTENWATSKALTYLMKNLLEERGYNVAVQTAEVEDIFKKLGKGEFDLFLDAWLPYTHDVYFYNEDGLVDITQIYSGCQLGLAVPPYSHLDSISDLYTDTTFDGKLLGIEEEGGVMLAADLALKAYNLKDDVEVINMEEEDFVVRIGELLADSSLFVCASWAPHWHNSYYNLKFLTDTSNSFGQEDQIHFVGRKGFEKSHQSINDFLKKVSFTPEKFESFLIFMRQAKSEVEYDKLTKQWIEENKDTINKWMNS